MNYYYTAKDSTGKPVTTGTVKAISEIAAMRAIKLAVLKCRAFVGGLRAVDVHFIGDDDGPIDHHFTFKQ